MLLSRFYAAAAAEKIKTRAPLIEGGYDEQQVWDCHKSQ